ncbi:MAG: hypothetical protein HQL10_04880 [Nitrospirae bacterium]|nr:hypothetical protein [Nitrospirota bacterium]
MYVLSTILRRLSKTANISPVAKPIWLSTGINYTFLTNFFSETSDVYRSAFHVKDALFLLEGSDSGQMLRYSSERAVEIVNVKNTPLSLNYIVNNVIRPVYCGTFFRQFLLSLSGEGNLLYWRIMYKAVTDKINFETLARRYGVRMYLTARFNENNAAKVMTINAFKGQAVGFQFGDVAHPLMNLFVNAYASVNHFFMYGDGLTEFKKCGHIIDSFHPVGLDRMDAFFRFKEQAGFLRLKHNPEKAFVIVVFGPAYNETLPRHRNVLSFYHSVFAAFLQVVDHNVKFIIKVHKKSSMADGEADFPELATLIELFRDHPKVHYCYYENPYELLAIADMVITWSSSTTGLEAIAAGKPTVFVDPMKSRYLIYGSFHPSLVVSGKKDLQRLVDMTIKGEYPVSPEVYERILRLYCAPNDGQAFQRILDILIDLDVRQWANTGDFN